MATITWNPDYFEHNVSISDSTCLDTSTFCSGAGCNGEIFSSLNQSGTSPGFTNVGNSSAGNENTAPVGTNFALGSGSAAIGYGLTSVDGQTFLPAQAVDAGACSSRPATCP
jgi:hypothetical protein